ncbi:MAG TPA: ROK family protein [Methylophilaceae bacterium]|nr:ROK family protein [Methylophilaceae bacterium]
MLIGMDIGGTNLRVGVIDGLHLIYEKRFPADFGKLCKTNPADVAWRQIIHITGSALQEARTLYPQISAVGIGFPGFIDPLNGRIAQSPNFPGLRNVDLASDLSTFIGLPVRVENDALAAAYGEYCLLASETDALIYIGLGTGVGGGLIYGHKPLAGQHGVAMEVGHIIVEPNGRPCGCGNRGCMEQYASASGVSLSYRELSGLDADANGVASAASSGDMHAIQAYSIAGASLAQALAHIIKVVDVGQVIIGGGMSLAWPLMQTAFNQRLQTDLIPVLRDKVQINISASGDRAGILGAALLAAS